MPDGKKVPILHGEITDITFDPNGTLNVTFSAYIENKDYKLVPQGLKNRAVNIPAAAFGFAQWMDSQMPSQNAGNFSVSSMVYYSNSGEASFLFEFKSKDGASSIDDMEKRKKGNNAPSEFERITVSIGIKRGKVSVELDGTSRVLSEAPFTYRPSSVQELESWLSQMQSLPFQSRNESVSSVKKRLDLKAAEPANTETRTLARRKQ